MKDKETILEQILTEVGSEQLGIWMKDAYANANERNVDEEDKSGYLIEYVKKRYEAQKND